MEVIERYGKNKRFNEAKEDTLNAINKKGQDMRLQEQREERANYDMGKEDKDMGESAPKRYFRDKINGLEKMSLKENIIQFYFFLLTDFKLKHTDNDRNIKFDYHDTSLPENKALQSKYTVSEWKAFVKNLLFYKYDGRNDMEGWEFDPALLLPVPEPETKPLTTRSGKEYKREIDTGILRM